MSTLTVLVAPQGQLAGVRDTLQDWSGAGLVDPFLWIEPTMTTGGRLAALSVEHGRLDGTSLQTLAGQQSFNRIRIASLVPALAGVAGAPGDIEQRVAEFLESSFRGSQVTRVRAIISRVGETVTVPNLVVEGWHNVVLSPEDAVGPGVGSKQLHQTSDTFDLGVHAASSLAGLLSLWAGVDSSPLDSAQILPGTLVRLTRSYFRHLDTTALEASLRQQVLSMERGLPLPTQFGVSTIYVDDAPLAARTMADELWARHPGVLRGPRETAPTAPVKAIGPGEALRMFFGFLWAALRNAPRGWALNLMNRVSASAASAVHNLVFGSAPSSYAVVVLGVTADGLPATWLELSDAATALDKLLDNPAIPREHVIHSDLALLWQDFAAGALTLADAGERVAGMSPVQIGSQRAVLRQVGLIIPDVDEGFTGIAPHIAASVGISSVEPYDVLGTFALEERLRKVATQQVMGVAASASLHELEQWKAQHAESYASRIGTKIGESLYATATEIRSLLQEIREAATADELLARIDTKQKRLARVLQALTLICVISLGVATAFFSLGSFEVRTFSAIAGGLLVAWLIAMLAFFLAGQRELFALINSRREVMNREALARRNLPLALADSRRLGEAYAQFLLWSRIVGTILKSPFGPSETEEVAVARKLDGLPLSIRLGTAMVDDTALASATNEIRREIFTVGWLTASWDTAISTAHAAVGPRGMELRADPLDIFRQRGSGPDSILPLWADALATNGIDRSVGDSHWSSIVSELEGDRRDLARTLLAQVGEADGSLTKRVTLADFMGLIDAPDQSAPDRLADGLLTDGARARGASTVESSSRAGSRTGLSRSVCLTQLSAAIPGYDLLAASADGPATSWDAPLPELFDGMPF